MLFPLHAVVEHAVNDQNATGGVMGVNELAAAIRRVLGTLPTASLNQAAALLAEAHQTLTNVAEGSRAQELEVAVAALGEAGQNVAAVTEMLRRIQRILDSYLGHLGVGEADPEQHTTSAGNTTAPPTPTTELASRVSGYRERLEHPWPYGKPLQGWRLSSAHEDRDHEVTSGTKLPSGEVDPAYLAGVKQAEALGLARGGFVPDIARHIEIKEASTMREGETRTIVIGKDPCGIDPVTNVSCHRFLRHFLPPDATLIVYGPTGKPYRYEGKRAS